MLPQYELRFPNGEHAISLSDAPRAIDRGPANDVVPADDTLPWCHAQVWLERGVPWLRDLGSRDGTWRSGQRATSFAQLRASDHVRIASGRACRLTGDRGVLLFVLARRLTRDRKANAAEIQRGWRTTQAVLTGIWGRGRKEADHLNVLVHRLRGQREERGFDPWLVEKRRGGIPVRCAEVTVQ